MNLYFRLWWLSLVFLLGCEILAALFFHIKPDSGIIAMFVLISLPLINMFIQEIKSDFFVLRFRSDWKTLIKGIALVIYGIYAYHEGFGAWNGTIGLYALFSVLFAFESRVSFLIALVFLSFCPIILITDHPNAAESLAVLAYYFLCIGVLARVSESVCNTTESHVR